VVQHYIALYKKDWHARERNTAQHGLRIEWLEQQLKDKEDLIASMNGRLHSAETQEVSRESALENARATAARAEERISASAGEIRKGNQIIERLQAELRSAKAKARLKAAIIAQQEKLLNDKLPLIRVLGRFRSLFGQQKLRAQKLNTYEKRPTSTDSNWKKVIHYWPATSR
jgi:chromosome segregation ATPase